MFEARDTMRRVNEKEFDDRVAIVIGASSGIGMNVATELAGRGARVMMFARSQERLDEICRNHPGKMIAISGDATDPEDIDRLFSETERSFGPCQLLVNSAGTIHPKTIEEMSLDDWDSQFAINTRGVFIACRRAIRGMAVAAYGSIVNVASISGVPGPQKFPGFAAYCASKAAVIAFTECLAVEVKQQGIRVNCVSPGSVDTPLLRRANESLKPDMTPEEVAGAILFLLSDRSRPINGQNLHVYSS